MASTRSPNGVLLGEQAPPRVRFEPPARSNSWEDVADLSASLGVVLDEWQEDVFEAAMGERSDGKWASRLVGVSTPRQNGKSQLIVARALAGCCCSMRRRSSVRRIRRTRRVRCSSGCWTSSSQPVGGASGRVGDEGSEPGVHPVQGWPDDPDQGSFGVGFARGFSADCLLLDEAQILGRPAWSSILPTMSARENPQAWLLGTPPTPQDDGEVFAQIREQALATTGRRMSYLEWSADDQDDLDDPATWAKANPAYGSRIQREAIEAERASMSDEQFAMERLGMWSADSATRVIDEQSWASGR
jgi:hypothetical protein